VGSRLGPWVGSAALLAIAFVGCTLLEPLDGFSEPPDALDGALEATSADSSATDAAAPTDGGADVLTPIDAGPFCARVDASFCEDFDDPIEASRWSLSTVQKAAHGIDDAAFTSAPLSLFARTNTLVTGESAASYRRVDFPSRMSSVTYAFDLRVDTRAQSEFLVAAAGLVDPAGVTYSASIVLGDTSDMVEEAREGVMPSMYADHVLGMRVPDGRWTRVSVSMTKRNQGGFDLLVTLDGQPVASTPLGLWAGITGGTPYITIGSAYIAGPSAPWAIRIDSLTVDMK